jgi:hypothetical protein
MDFLSKKLVIVSLASGAASVSVYYLLNRILASTSRKKKAATQEPSKIYELKSLLDQYMLFNFANKNDIFLVDVNDDALANIYNCAEFPKKVAALSRVYCADLFDDNNEVRPHCSCFQ